MTTATKLKLAERRTGRIVLHLMALKRDHGFARHWQGIFRELAPRHAHAIHP